MSDAYDYRSSLRSDQGSEPPDESRHRHRRRGTGFIPLDSDGSGGDEVRRRRRRRRRHGGLGGLEVFIGLSALWTFLVVGVVMIEALGGQQWFFVGIRAEPENTRHPVVIGDALGLGGPLPQSQEEDGGTTVSGGKPHLVEVRWGRLILVLACVPALYLTWRIARRLRRSSRRGAD